jgi:aminopeptidase N
VSGRGYEFLKNILIELDAVNPQVASRMITPLLSFKRYDDVRQSKMRDILKALSGRDLSKDLFEKVSAALND